MTTYEQYQKNRKALNALKIRRRAVTLAEERHSGARLQDLTSSQLADIMADATEEVLS
jgi:uncharacterized protein YjiS (DUF1127 family)